MRSIRTMDEVIERLEKDHFVSLKYVSRVFLFVLFVSILLHAASIWRLNVTFGEGFVPYFFTAWLTVFEFVNVVGSVAFGITLVVFSIRHGISEVGLTPIRKKYKEAIKIVKKYDRKHTYSWFELADIVEKDQLKYMSAVYEFSPVIYYKIKAYVYNRMMDDSTAFRYSKRQFDKHFKH